MVPIVVLLPTSKHVLNKTEEEQVYNESGYCFKVKCKDTLQLCKSLKKFNFDSSVSRQTTSSCAQVCGNYFDNAATVILLPN